MRQGDSTGEGGAWKPGGGSQVKGGENGCALKVEPAGNEAPAGSGTERGVKDALSQGVDSPGAHQMGIMMEGMSGGGV